MTMRSGVEADIMAYLADPGSSPNPYPMFHALRRLQPVYSPRAGLWVISGFHEAEEMLRSPDFSRQEAALDDLDRMLPAGEAPQESEAARIYQRWFSNRDRPDHTRLRRLVAPAFKPSMMRDYQRTAEVVVDAVLNDVMEREHIDFKSEFAFRIPQGVFCRVMGIPPSDEILLNGWLPTIVNNNKAARAADEVWQQWSDAVIGLTEYCRDLIRDRRRTGLGEDLLSGLIIASESEELLDEDELVSTLVVLFIGGHETTLNLLTNAMFLLLEHRDEWMALQHDPSLAAAVIEETLRYETPTRINHRKALVDTALGSASIAAGDTINVLMGAVNRDPARFDSPDVFDIRRHGPGHLAFGGGIHFCVGSPLARMQAPFALRTLADRADVSPRESVEWLPGVPRRALGRLPVTIRSRTAS